MNGFPLKIFWPEYPEFQIGIFRCFASLLYLATPFYFGPKEDSILGNNGAFMLVFKSYSRFNGYEFVFFFSLKHLTRGDSLFSYVMWPLFLQLFLPFSVLRKN